MLLCGSWPSTRLVHAFTAPVGYLFRPYIVYRSRQGGPATPPRTPRLGKDLMSTMQKTSLDALAREQIEAARGASSGRAARTVYGGHEHVLRQTVIGLRAGHSLAEHQNPGEATLHVLRGRVRLISGDTTWDGRTGDLLIIPDALHSLEAIDDSAVLLTVAKATSA
jgi:quercetin dioxygenase-like cupin family protein